MPAARLAARSPSPLPALPIVPIVPEIMPVDPVYHACVVAQRTTTDLTVYTRDLGRIIMVAYPLGPLGVRIVPSGIFSWMERRGLVLECFCALISSQPTPARFVDEFLSRHTVVRCHHVDDRCGFYLDLTKIHLMTMYESSYEYLPTLSFGVPKIPAILARWHCLVTCDTTLLQHPAPFVRGYFSIHISMYPGVQQLRSGLSKPLAIATPRGRASYHPYHRRHASQPTNNGITGPSRLTGSILPQFSERETDALDALKVGLGVSQEQMENLFEQCDHCGQSFMRSALRVHIKEVVSDIKE